MTFNEAAAILNTPSNPNTQLDNAIYVYRNLGTLADQIKELQSKAKDIATKIMYDTNQLEVTTPSGTAMFTQPSVRITWNNKALNALCASNQELDKILSPYYKAIPVASTLVIKGNNQ